MGERRGQVGGQEGTAVARGSVDPGEKGQRGTLDTLRCRGMTPGPRKEGGGDGPWGSERWGWWSMISTSPGRRAHLPQDPQHFSLVPESCHSARHSPPPGELPSQQESCFLLPSSQLQLWCLNAHGRHSVNIGQMNKLTDA